MSAPASSFLSLQTPNKYVISVDAMQIVIVRASVSNRGIITCELVTTAGVQEVLGDVQSIVKMIDEVRATVRSRDQ